MTQTE